MKKTIALILVLLVALALTTPFLALSEANPPVTIEAAQNGAQELTEAPVIENDAPGVIDPDPGRPVIDLTQLLLGVITVILGILARYVGPWIKARTKKWQWDLLCEATHSAVEAAEQTLGSGAGKEKLAKVVTSLESQGFTVNADMIETFVRNLPESWQKRQA